MNAGEHCGGTNPMTLFAAIGMLVCGVALPFIFYGSAMRETAERAQAAQTAEENKALRERLGIMNSGNQLRHVWRYCWKHEGWKRSGLPTKSLAFCNLAPRRARRWGLLRVKLRPTGNRLRGPTHVRSAPESCRTRSIVHH